MTDLSPLTCLRRSQALLLILALSLAAPCWADDGKLTPDASIPIPALEFDRTGALVIRASAASSQHDFDFLIGNWTLKSRKLASRLTQSTEWISFESRVEMHQILEGAGNIDWADSNSGKLDPPVVETYRGRPIIMVFLWDVRDPKFPVWSQAFSVDDGKTREWPTERSVPFRMCP